MIQRIGIIGAGTMGCGIAQLCLQQGFSVKIYDASPEAMCKAAGRLKEGFDAAVLKGKLTTYQAERSSRAVAYAKELGELSGADLIIEAASEDLELKRSLFKAISAICPDSILATNTSSLSVTAVAEAAQRPQRVLGLHFFNPPIAMKLVEMVKTPQTDAEVFQAVWEFAMSGLRKIPVDVKDTPGFIVNRVMRPYYLEAQRAALAGCGIAALDQAAREIGQMPLGPFELMDLIGLDVNFSITKVIYEAFGKPERFKPVAIQEKLVAMGHLGRKSGKGFYLYSGKKPAGENPEALALIPKNNTLKASEAWERVIGSVITEAEKALVEGVAGKSDIDTAIKLAMNFPKGPLQWREKITEKSIKAEKN